jgi:hypothetical protein
MTSTWQVYLKIKNIKQTFNTQLATRNILITIAFCLVYLLGKYYRPVHIPSGYDTIKIRYTKHK